MAIVGREKFLSALDFVSPGLSGRNIVEQASCFAFRDGSVWTYNEEVCCSQKIDGGLIGAVASETLLELLRKLKEEELDVSAADGKLLVKGAKGRRSWLQMDAEVLLPIDSVERPEKWRRLPDGFLDALDIVGGSAGEDESKFLATCVHIHPNWLEACDDTQLTRFTLETGVSQPYLVRHTALKHAVQLGITKVAQTDAWVHFKNPNGLVLSCRRYVEEYEDMSGALAVKGTKVTLPKSMSEAIERAEIFSKTHADANRIKIELMPGKLRLKGEGIVGGYSEPFKSDWKGKAIAFWIPPKVLTQVIAKEAKVVISDKEDKIKVSGERWEFVASLAKVEEQSDE